MSDDSSETRADHSQAERLTARGRSSKGRNRRSLSSIDSVLNRLVSSMGLDRRLKEHTLLSLWPTLIGDKFAHKSRPLFLDSDGNIVIAVKDASVGQELSLLKPEIIKKMRLAAGSLGLSVNGMRLDLKHYYTGNPQLNEAASSNNEQRSVSEPSPAELAHVQLSESELSEIAQLKSKLPLDANSQLNERIFSMFEQELKLRQWRRLQGFPLCPRCHSSTQSLHGNEGLCRDCYFTALSQSKDF